MDQFFASGTEITQKPYKTAVSTGSGLAEVNFNRSEFAHRNVWLPDRDSNHSSRTATIAVRCINAAALVAAILLRNPSPTGLSLERIAAALFNGVP